MPSHNIHRFCAFLIGLSEDIASHVDSVIDSGTCFVHDVGLEDAVTFINEEACIVFGVHAAIYCLYRDEKLSEDSLKALALHMLLDCIDRKAESSHGSGQVFQRCLNFIENRIRVAMSSNTSSICIHYPLPKQLLDIYSLKLLKIIQSIASTSRNALEKCPTLLPALKGEGSCYCGEVWDYIPSPRGFNPGPGLQPITPIPLGTRGYEHIECSH